MALAGLDDLSGVYWEEEVSDGIGPKTPAESLTCANKAISSNCLCGGSTFIQE